MMSGSKHGYRGAFTFHSFLININPHFNLTTSCPHLVSCHKHKLTLTSSNSQILTLRTARVHILEILRSVSPKCQSFQANQTPDVCFRFSDRGLQSVREIRSCMTDTHTQAHTHFKCKLGVKQHVNPDGRAGVHVLSLFYTCAIMKQWGLTRSLCSCLNILCAISIHTVLWRAMANKMNTGANFISPRSPPRHPYPSNSLWN